MIDKKINRPGRRWPFVLLALGLLGGGAALALRHYTQPEKLTALLIEQAHGVLGADLSINGAAAFGFVPKLSVTLPQPTLKAAGASVAWLRADALRAVVPWHTLWSDRHDIERIELVKPVLDIDALHMWLAARAPSKTGASDVRFCMRINDGSVVRGGITLAQGVNADFASSGDVASWLAAFDAKPGPTALLPPLAGGVDAAAMQIGDTRLEGVHVEISDLAAAAKSAKQP